MARKRRSLRTRYRELLTEYRAHQTRTSGYLGRLVDAKRQAATAELVYWSAPLCEIGKDVKARIETAAHLGYRIEVYVKDGGVQLRAVKWERA